VLQCGSVAAAAVASGRVCSKFVMLFLSAAIEDWLGAMDENMKCTQERSIKLFRPKVNHINEKKR